MKNCETDCLTIIFIIMQMFGKFLEVMCMEKGLIDRVALVTGAASGIGMAIALRFAKEGAKVSVVDLNFEEANKVVNKIQDLGGKAIAIQCDISDEYRAGQLKKPRRNSEELESL